MRLLVFGASGGCGSQLVSQALTRGHDVTAVVRPEASVGVPSQAEVLIGDVTSAAFVAEVVPGHDVILSALGLRRASVVPWSRLLSPPHLVQTFIANLREAVGGNDVSRAIWISAGGVGDSRGLVSAPVGKLIGFGSVGAAYTDLEAAEASVPADDIRWLAVRPVTLVNGPVTGRARPVDRYGLLSTVRRADVAAWMLDVADGTQRFDGRAVLLG